MIPVRWDPFREVLTLQDRMNRLFGDAPSRWTEDEPGGAWAPAVDIFEMGDDLVVRAELPGVQKDDIEVSVENGVLTIRGERRKEKELQEENVHRIERRYGSFVRSFTLPTTVSAEKIKATYKDGVLDLVLPKAEEAKPKKVMIQAA
jgi:HSP20 family protein